MCSSCHVSIALNMETPTYLPLAVSGVYHGGAIYRPAMHIVSDAFGMDALPISRQEPMRIVCFYSALPAHLFRQVNRLKSMDFQLSYAFNIVACVLLIRELSIRQRKTIFHPPSSHLNFGWMRKKKTKIQFEWSLSKFLNLFH